MVLLCNDGLYNKLGLRPQTGVIAIIKGHNARCLQTTTEMKKIGAHAKCLQQQWKPKNKV